MEGKRILIADDDAAGLRAMRRLFVFRSCSVECFTRGDDALRAIEQYARRRRLPHGVLLDNEMPGLAGIEVLANIHQLGLINGMRIALYSGTGDEELKRKVEEYGARYFPKPIPNLNELLRYFIN